MYVHRVEEEEEDITYVFIRKTCRSVTSVFSTRARTKSISGAMSKKFNNAFAYNEANCKNPTGRRMRDLNVQTEPRSASRRSTPQ